MIPGSTPNNFQARDIYKWKKIYLLFLCKTPLFSLSAPQCLSYSINHMPIWWDLFGVDVCLCVYYAFMLRLRLMHWHNTLFFFPLWFYIATTPTKLFLCFCVQYDFMLLLHLMNLLYVLRAIWFYAASILDVFILCFCVHYDCTLPLHLMYLFFFIY